MTKNIIMDQKAFSKIWIIVFILILTSGGIFTWQYFNKSDWKLPHQGPTYEELIKEEAQEKEKCEESGGKWLILCSSIGCVSGYCDCGLACSEKNFPEFNSIAKTKTLNKDTQIGLVQTDLSKCGELVESDGQCINCQTSEDCRKTPLSQGRCYCFEYNPKCIKGVCYTERKIYLGYKITSNGCENACGDGVCGYSEILFCPNDCK